ncbi:AAA family ATPase [Paracoccus sp. (in: a-proteobacteria)]|uniref:AAA family ATPase n=1 Tax=Paracoccus sp. TaxID=267 RepID=UPI0028A04208|nr:AAA family ATPase [Paracoccus sp. (in: a-proteobacteria)]
MADPALLQSLTLEGFRAYLQPKTFDFSKKPNLAIFAPNGRGKSSVIDALEFLFSEHGTLERLGQRALNNQAGPSALAHNAAQAVGIEPVVRFTTIMGKVVAEGSRRAIGNSRLIHAAATAMKAGFIAAPIIRGYTLRTFVEEHSPENRYSIVASWLQLSPLVEVQKNLRLLRREVRAAAESTTEQARLAELLRTETDQAVQAWDAAAVLDFLNANAIAPLDPGLRMATLDTADAGYLEIVKRVEAEEKRVGLAELKQICKSVAALWQKMVPEDGGDPIHSGAIAAFENALSVLADATATEADERDKAAGTVFRSVWNEAEKLFAEDARAPEECPVCATPIGDTAAGSVPAVRDLLQAHLDDLRSYNDAKTALDDAKTAATQAHNRLEARLPGMIDHLSEGDPDDFRASLIAFQAGIAGWPASEAPASAAITAELEARLVGLDREIAEIEEKQGERTWVKAKASVDRLLKLQTDVALATRTTEELITLHDALGTQAMFISGRIREKVQSLLDTLQAPMSDIYKEIQGDEAKPIRLELPGEDDANQQRMQLVIDFAENRQGVAPGGYLSDSQLHSVALALRLAAIKKFNGAAPMIALDDVVTSYDADHRRAIGALLAKMFTDCQIILVTHDERFFNYLKDQLAEKDWQFMRIVGLEPTFGPLFANHKVTDEMIADRWARDESAANEMRQAEEEWLLGIARGFGVNVRIRQLEKAYSYERSELASAIGGFLSDLKLTPANVPGVNNRFIASLVKGDIENFGSHFQEAPYGDGSIGDEKARWDEFKAFRGQFECVCGRTKYQRPFGLSKPVCADDKCETQFAFKPIPNGAAAGIAATAKE